MIDVMLFAAGLGTRMGKLTTNRPKPLIEVGEITLLDHALKLTEIPQIRGRVVNVHYKADQLVAHLSGADVVISNESDLLRDTGGGLLHALPLITTDPMLTLNTDAVWSGISPIPLILDSWSDDMDCLLMVVPKDRSRGHNGPGNLQLASDGDLKFGQGHVYTGLQMIRRRALAPYDSAVFSLREIWIDLAQKGRLRGVSYPGLWCDVGRPECLPIAEKMLRESTNV